MSQDKAALQCAEHPERVAVAGCIECGRLVCAQCRLVGDDGLTRCVQCAQPASVEPSEPTEDALVEPTEPTPVETEPAPTEQRPPRRVAPAHEDAPLPSWAQPKQAPPKPKKSKPKTTPQVPAEITEWERAGGNDLMAWLRTVFGALSSPVRFPLSVPWARGDYRSPLIYALLCAGIGYLIGVLTGAFGWAELPIGLRDLVGEPAPLPPLVYHLLMLPMLPLIIAVRIGVMAGATHLLLRLMGATHAPFEATFRAYCYAQTGKLLWALPGIGPMVDYFYAVFLLLGGLRVAHQTRFGTGLVAMLPLVLLSGQAF